MIILSVIVGIQYILCLINTTTFAVQAIVGAQQFYVPTSCLIVSDQLFSGMAINIVTKHTRLRRELGNLEIKTTINVLANWKVYSS